MLTSRSAAHRVEALEEAGRCEESIDGSFDFFMSASRNAGRHAALILGYLERLGEPYGPPAVRTGYENSTLRWNEVCLQISDRGTE